jgi:hypothetical protein
MPIVHVDSSTVPANPRIYHITDVSNLLSIAHRDLLCANAMHNTATSYTNIAHDSIQARRTRTVVTCGPGGSLHDYVPFHFAPRPPMLLPIRDRRVGTHQHGQEPVIHLVASISWIEAQALRFVFTDGHAIMQPLHFYDDLRHLKEIDWSVMPSTYWNNTLEDPDRCRRRNAEFLVHSHFPWEGFEAIGVINDTMASAVRGILEGLPHQPTVYVRRGWYY